MEISEFHPISQPAPAAGVTKRQGYTQPFYGELGMRCEDCPSAKVCKKLGNFRESCEPNNPRFSQDMSMGKCIVSSNLLLARLVDKLERQGG